MSQSNTIKGMLEDLRRGVHVEKKNWTEVLSLPNIEVATYKKVLEWCQNHASLPSKYHDNYWLEQVYDANEEEFMSPRKKWERTFISDIFSKYESGDSDPWDIFEAANFLQIEDLEDLLKKNLSSFFDKCSNIII